MGGEGRVKRLGEGEGGKGRGGAVKGRGGDAHGK